MAKLGGRRKHVLFTDSRGKYLQRELTKQGISSKDFVIFPDSGARFQRVIRNADEYADERPSDIIYIAAGINNVTNKCRVTKVVTFEWQSSSALSEYLIDTLNTGYAYLHKWHPTTKFVFCSIPGVLLEGLVPYPTENDQAIVNEAIWSFNIAVRQLNERLGSYHPRLDRPVHRNTRGNHLNNYSYLHDGLHPSTFMLSKWVHELRKAMKHN